MPSAKRRNFGKGPVSRAVLDFHNRHTKETYPEVMAKKPRKQERAHDRYQADSYPVREIYEEY